MSTTAQTTSRRARRRLTDEFFFSHIAMNRRGIPLVTLAATSAAADITGIVMASVLAAIGFLVLPAKRKQAKDQMRRKIAAVREQLSEALRKQFSTEAAQSTARIREGIAPYSRFIRAEGDKLREIDAELHEIRDALASLRARIERPAA